MDGAEVDIDAVAGNSSQEEVDYSRQEEVDYIDQEVVDNRFVVAVGGCKVVDAGAIGVVAQVDGDDSNNALGSIHGRTQDRMVEVPLSVIK